MGNVTKAQTPLSLKECKTKAFQNNYKLKNSKLEYDAAVQIKKNAFTNYFPKVSATAFAMQAKDPLMNMQMPGGNLPVYDGNPANIPAATEFAYMPGGEMPLFQKVGVGALTAMQPIYVGGKIVNGNKLAQVNVDVKQAQVQLSEQELELNVEKQYWLLVSLQEKQQILLAYDSLLGQIGEQVNSAYNSGLVIKNDVLKVQIKRSELELSKKQLNNGLSLVRQQLCQTMGVEYDSNLTVADKVSELKMPMYYYATVDSTLPNRTEYKMLQQAVYATKLQKKMATGDHLPTLSVGAAAYHMNPLEKNIDGTNNAMLFATLSVPISDWWGGSHASREKELKYQIAQNNLNDTKELLSLQMNKLWLDVNDAYDRITLLEENQLQIDENLKLHRGSYENGLTSLSDLLEAQAMATEQQVKLIEAKQAYRLAVLQYLNSTSRKMEE